MLARRTPLWCPSCPSSTPCLSRWSSVSLCRLPSPLTPSLSRSLIFVARFIVSAMPVLLVGLASLPSSLRACLFDVFIPSVYSCTLPSAFCAFLPIVSLALAVIGSYRQPRHSSLRFVSLFRPFNVLWIRQSFGKYLSFLSFSPSSLFSL